MKHRPASTHGFALVIALSLMAFILLLILSITTLVRVETQSANIQLGQLEARMNAQLGAMVALGDLQRYTGPDQRVTARADILLAPDGPDIAGQSRWTGVWSSKEITNDSLDRDDGLDERQPRWLVSGNETNGLIINSNIPVSGDTADLATIGGSVTNKSNQDDTVKAPKVEILGDDNALAGHYAYWVSDEGVKARVNMADPFLDSGTFNPNDPNSDEAYYRTAMAQVADPTAVSNSDGVQLLTVTSSRWKDGAQDPGKIGSLKNIPMFLEDDLPGEDLSNVSREFFHDFTVHSSGVLANTKDGGLKRDLSTGLLNLPSDMTGPMFEPAGGSVALGDPGGPKWEQLADYFSYAESGSGNQTYLDFRMPTPDQVGVSPVVTRFNYVVQVFAERRSTATPQSASYIDQVADYNYYVGMFPLITLWNPYDKPMSFPDLGLQFDMRGIVLREKPAGGDLVAMVLPRNSISQVKDQGWRRMIGMTIGGGIIPAGTAVNYTPPINSKISLTDASKNVLKQGASDKLIRGFFYGPTNIANAPKASGKAFFVDNNGLSSSNIVGRRPIPFGSSRDVGKNTDEITSNYATSTNFTATGGGHWSTVINLYASPSLDKEERFFTLTGPGFGKIYFYNGNSGALNKLPRVVVLNNLGASSSTISGVGTSVSASYDDYSDFDLQEINNLAGGLAIVAVIKNFPKLVSGTDKEDPARGINLLSQFNPRATKSYRQVHMEEAKKDAGNKGKWKEANMGYVQYASGPYTQWMPNMYRNWVGGTDAQYSDIGLGNSSSTEGSDKMVLFEAPTRPPVSIGQLMHANLLNTSEISSQFESVSGWTTNHQQVHTAPAYAIGNSIANVHLPLTETRVSLAQNGSKKVTASKPDGTSSEMFPDPNNEPLTWKHDSGRMKGSVYDYSYELNNALWDEYFLSGLGSDNVKFPLPNSQLKRRSISEGVNANAQENELKNERLAAAHLMLDGAFNINSTSVAAWESILGAMRDIYTLGEPGTGVSDDDQLHNYSRFVSPIMESAISSDPETGGSLISYNSSDDLEAITAGYRSLTDEEIAMLAEKLVDEIRRRSSVKEHPFLSLSNFINRSIDLEDFNNTPAQKRFMYTGALQSAIDQSGLNGRAPFNVLGEIQPNNDGLWEDGYVYEPFKGATPSGSSQYFPYLEDSVAAIEDRPLMEGAPGFLMQADVLSKIGGKLSARSDTFMIRSYGNSIELVTGSNKAESYFELVVQRAPEYLDSLGNTPDTKPDSLSPLNEKFGRRYEIVSQRWINIGDI